MQVGIVAKNVGLSVDTIRFYERNALLSPPARTQGGLRRYGECDIESLAFIRCVQGRTCRLRSTRRCESRYQFPGWPLTIRGRANLMASFSGYGKTIKLHSGDAFGCASFSGWSCRDPRIRRARQNFFGRCAL
jgi:hypothetical protein